jgi:hypothetical protein
MKICIILMWGTLIQGIPEGWMHLLNPMGDMPLAIIEERQEAQPTQVGHIGGMPLTKCPIGTTICNSIILILAVYIVEILTRWRKEIAEMMMNNVITMYLLDSIEELPIPRDLIFMHQNLIDIQGQAACARQAFQPHRLAIYQAVLIKKRSHKYNTIP